MSLPHRIRIVDTHTGGEPTRIIIEGGPDLGCGSMADRRARFSSEFDSIRSAVVCEPRGSDVVVGAILTPPEHANSLAGVIFFNNVGFLGMCGHGTIGVVRALAHLGRVSPGQHYLDTPVGQVAFELLGDGRVAIENVPSYRLRKEAPVRLSDGRIVHGDVAWGGNWFYICHDHQLSVELAQLESLDRLAKEIRREMPRQGVTGLDGAEIDHVELVGLPLPGEPCDARNFVLCPGGAYDRSPCGTGTSAKVACLAADGKLVVGRTWRQASLIGSQFEATFRPWQSEVDAGNEPSIPPDAVVVRLVGSAYVNAEAELILDPEDPFCMGIR